MTTYIIRRILQAIPTIIGVTIITFIIIQAAPGDPVQILTFAPGITAEERDNLRRELCLDKPVVRQYLNWVFGDWTGECDSRGLIRGDFGESFRTRRPVLQMFIERTPATLQLTTYAFAIGGTIGLLLGIVSAVFRGGAIDNVARFFSVVFDALPPFWFGIILIMFFSVQLGWFPVGGQLPLNENNPTLVDRVRHLFMPSLVLGVSWIALMSRYMRAETLEVMSQDYIRTAHAKGLSSSAVYLVHVARNAMIPIVTILGPALTALIGGSVIIERIFSWPGIGRMVVDAVSQRDIPVVMASTIIGAVLVILGNLISDILLAIVDPRIRFK